MADINSYEELKNFLKSKTGLRMFHIYKPVMLLTVLRSGGAANKEQIAREFLQRDSNQIDYYRRRVVHPMPGTRLVRDGLLAKEKDVYSLIGVLADLDERQSQEVEEILEKRIKDHLEMRNPFGDSNLDAVPGSLRFEVLRRAGGRCELCGASSKDIQIDVDHIVPRAKGGSNKITNLQALCRTCNAQKRDRDDTDFRKVHDSYSHREEGCIFCKPGNRVTAENELAFTMNDGYPVTEDHTLVIPKRHVADYFDLHMAERNAIESLLRQQREALLEKDKTITGFNVGINSGESAGQTIFHVHVHLMPRRDGDVDNPRGGVRHTIPEKGLY